MAQIKIIQVPFDSGFEHARTGRGPGHFIKNGLEAFLRENGHDAEIGMVGSNLAFPTEIGTMVDTNRTLAQQVRSAIESQRLPVVLAGNCNSCVGSLAGLKEGRHGILWLDAHGDFNTPESTITGFLDGMGLAMAAGRCWKALLSTVPGFKPVAEDCIIHVGSRDFDPEERRSLSEARIPLVAGDPKDKAGLLAALHHALMPLKQRVDGIYLHVDLDVLETEQGKPNHLAVAGGLPLPLVLDAIEMIVQHFKIEACALASFDPDCDENHAVLKAGFRIIQAMVSS